MLAWVSTSLVYRFWVVTSSFKVQDFQRRLKKVVGMALRMQKEGNSWTKCSLINVLKQKARTYTKGNANYNAKDGYRNLIKTMEAKKGALVSCYIEVWRWTAKFESKNGCGPYNFIKKKKKN